MLSAFMLRLVMLSVTYKPFMLSIIMLNVMLSVVMLSVVALTEEQTGFMVKRTSLLYFNQSYYRKKLYSTGHRKAKSQFRK